MCDTKKYRYRYRHRYTDIDITIPILYNECSNKEMETNLVFKKRKPEHGQ